MKIVVAVKRVIDPYVKIRINADNSGVETQHVKMGMNPFDEIALEEALRLKEQGIASEVVIVSIGDKSVPETLRVGLALGADRAIHVETDARLSSLAIAKIVQKIIEQEQPQLVLLGKQSIDGDNSQTGPMLAALLDWPQASFASRMVINENIAQVTCEVDGGLLTVALDLPAIVTTDLRLNTPRYASLPNIMKAKTKPLRVIALTDLQMDLTSHLTLLEVTPPAARKPGIMVATAHELIDKLRHEAKVIA